MKKAEPKPHDERAARLAQALRANLHRRKAQARALDEQDEPGADRGRRPEPSDQ
ncbi:MULTISPECIES: hypothetical protein [unclassified Sphingomonas]|uniref:hypothetical protein n=1 Tax=unclassified Sphingomonas TaxID=196159 RepID=UPI001910AA6E|nr:MULTISPECIES: hypothetical protein [unclassified Sphingomonas]